MMSSVHNNDKLLEDAIKAELENGISVSAGKPLMRILSKLRNWQNRGFDARYPRIGNITQGDISTLTEHEKFVFSKFKDCRNQQRQLSYHYAAEYKGGYILNYNLAVSAVSLAVVSLGTIYMSVVFENEVISQFIGPLVLLLGVGKAICLLLILVNTRQSHRYEFNQRAIIFRYLAEQFRIMLYLPLLGIRRLPVPSVGRFVATKLKESYLERYCKEKVKEVFALTDVEGIKIDYNERLLPILLFIQADWVKGQIDYHSKNSVKQLAVNERLEKLVSRFNVTVLTIVVFDIIVDLAGVFSWLPEQIHRIFHLYATPVILIAATIIPAFVGSYNGLRFQTEAKKLYERASFMKAVFEELDKKYEVLIARIKIFEGQSNSPGSFTSEAITLVNETAEVMIDEVAEWTLIYSKEILDT